MAASETALTVVQHGELIASNQWEDFAPVFPIHAALQLKESMDSFTKKILREGVDYGVIPGTAKEGKEATKALMKPGAEKLCKFFGLSPRLIEDKIIEDWTGKDHGGEPFFYYRYKVQLYRGERFIAEAVGSANSWESKHRYRWMREEDIPEWIAKDSLRKRGGRTRRFEPEFALNKKETGGKWGKPAEYWQAFGDAIAAGTAKRTKKQMGQKEQQGWEIEIDDVVFRVPNPDAADLVNSLQKMATKRALVAAVLIGTNASDNFTQDLDEDLPAHEEAHHDLGPTETPEQVAARRLAEEQAKDAMPITDYDGDEVPADLVHAFHAIGDKLVREKTSRYLEEQMIAHGGQDGAAVYKRATEEFKAQHKGKQVQFADIYGFWKKIHAIVTIYKSDALAKDIKADGITDADLPEILTAGAQQ